MPQSPSSPRLARWSGTDSRTWKPRFDPAASAVVRLTTVAASVVFAFLAAVTSSSHLTRPEPWSYLLWMCAGVALASAVLWALTPSPLTGVASITFVFVADIFVAVGLVALRDPLIALVACNLFVVIATYACLYLSPLWFAAHMVFTTLFVIDMALLSPHVTMTLLAATLSLWNVLAVPMVIRRLWTVTRRDAERAYRDPLTGMLNRTGLEREFEELVLAARRDTTDIAVLVIDLDRFKAINDQFGHLVGDAVIVETAQLLHRHFPRSASVARTGGEEFVVAVRGRPPALADVIAGLPTMTFGMHGPRVTMSVGAVLCDFSVFGADPLTTAMSAADRAMYSAKQSGGNRCVSVV